MGNISTDNKCDHITQGKGTKEALLESEKRFMNLLPLAETELQSNEEKLHTITNAVLDAVVMMDPSGNIAHWNPAAEAIFGYSSTEVLGRPVHDFLVPPQYREAATNGCSQFYASGQGAAIGHTLELVALHKNGHDFPVELSLNAIEQVDGWWAVAVIRDITHRKQVEERILYLTQLQTELLLPGTISEKSKKITDAVIEIFNADFCRLWLTHVGDRCNTGCVHALVTEGPHVCCEREKCLKLISSSGRYTHINGEVHQRVPFGCYKIGRVAADQERKFLTNDAIHDPRVHNHQWAEELGLVSFAGYQLRPPNGETIGVLALFSQHSISPEEDTCLEMLANIAAQTIQVAIVQEQLIQNVADLENANKALEEFSKASDAANQAKSEFLANMSHEIRTPMTAILGFTDIFLNYAKEADAIDAAETVKRNGEHLLQIINDILDISKIEVGKIDIEPISYSPIQIIEEIVSLMHVRAIEKGLDLTNEYAGPLPETILTDPHRLRQILINLVGNAIKFTEAGGVRIVTHLVDVSVEEPKIQFDIIDTGIGIQAELVEKLFEPFTQADSSSSRIFEGTGLGLAISRKLAALLNGNISVHSKPDEGSTFSLTVPTGSIEGIRLLEFSKETSSREKNQIGLPDGCAEKLSCRILLAEDCADNQRLVKTIFNESGAEIAIAENGQEAVEMVLAECRGGHKQHLHSSKPFDIILMDIQMPLLDGIQAMEKLRREGYTDPIIAFTAHAMTEDQEKYLDLGFDDYFTKPIDREKLLECVKKWISKRQKQSRNVIINDIPS